MAVTIGETKAKARGVVFVNFVLRSIELNITEGTKINIGRYTTR